MSDLTPLPPGIVLCVRCGARLSALKAIPDGATPLCTDCADEQASTRRLRAVRPVEWVSIDENPAPLPRTLPWLTYAAAAAVVAIAGVAMTMRRPAQKDVPAVVVLSPETPVPAPPPAEDAGQKVLEERREAEAVRLRELARAQEDLASLDQETAGPETLEEYGRVFEMLEKARGRHAEEAWTRGIEERIALLRGKVDSHFAAVRQFDAESSDPGEKAKLRERVTHWGMPAYAAELEKSVKAAPPPPPPPRSKEAQAYLEEWERAMARAAARDYDRAFPDLRKAAKGLQEEATRREAATDLDDLQRVMMVHEEIGRIV
ncbi:MAG TPA: hypothetical protein VJB14_12270, partial [Planctomycetota bacterium]|nr:hypothetical protein [Planctomycetota bacterium]